MIESVLIHLATINRPSQAISAELLSKSTAETLVAASVPCRIVQIGTSPDVMGIGFGDSASAVGYFDEGQDIQRGDEVTRTDESDNTVYTVEGIDKIAVHVGGDSGHIEVSLRRKDAG